MQVIIADSNELILLGLRTILNAQSGVQIVGEAKNQHELMAQLQNFGADVVLIDFTAPGFDIDIIRKARAKYTDLRFVAVTEGNSWLFARGAATNALPQVFGAGLAEFVLAAVADGVKPATAVHLAVAASRPICI